METALLDGMNPFFPSFITPGLIYKCVCRILSVLDELNYQKPPSVAVLPLGTGNDLARTLGWGGGYKNESLRSFLKRVSKGKVVKLDRWDLFASPKPQTSRDSTEEVIQVEGAKKSEKLPLSVLNNYFSIGADAKIALEFHLARGTLKPT